MDKPASMFPWTRAVTRAVRRVAVSRRVWAALAIVVVAIPAAIHVRAWVFRWQARRFLNDVRALEMGKTSGAEALKLRERWSRSWLGPNSDECTPERCWFSAGVFQWVGDEAIYQKIYSHDSAWLEVSRGVVRVLAPVGLRLAGVSATILVRRGVVVGVSVTFAVSDYPGGTVLLGAATARPNLNAYGAVNHWLGLQRHPHLLVSHATGMDRSGAVAEYTSQVSREEFLQLTDFNLSCATAVLACGDNEIAPGIERKIREDGDQAAGWGPCTTDAMRRLGRDAEAVAHLRVRAMAGDDQGVAYVEYDLLEKLKDGSVLGRLMARSREGVSSEILRLPHRLDSHGPMIDAQTGKLSPTLFQPGTKVIAFLETDAIREIPCGVAPATAENLAAVRAGIAEDRTEEWK